MKRASIFFLFLVQLTVSNRHAISQVWNGDLVFSSQVDIDNFGNFSYTSVNGNLRIDDNMDGQHDITNLAGLAGLTSVSGFLNISFNNLLPNTVYLNLVSVGVLSISNNPALTIINGLPLTSMGLGLTITNNASLTSITAFTPITSIGGQLNIQNNPLLTNFSGFTNLATVTGSLILGNNNSMTNVNSFSRLNESHVLIIRNNPSLANINGLSALTRVDQFNILNNPLLANIDGLSGLTTVTNSLEIGNNPLLQNITGLANLSFSSFAAMINIHHNNGLQNIIGPNGSLRMGTLNIEENPALTNISGFAGLRTASGIQIVANRALVNISGFNMVDTVFGHVRLEQNNALTGINAFPNLAFVTGNLSYINNYTLSTISTMPLLDSVFGDVRLALDTMLTNLDFIPNIRGTGGRLSIASCYKLANINGLSHFRSVGGDLSFFDCPLITNLDVLSGITLVGGRLLITGMNGLHNIAGLKNITKVMSDLHVSANSQLTSLEGLVGIDSVGRDLVITSNPLINNLNGLRNLRKTYLIYIQNNIALAEFCGLYQLYANGGPTLGTTISQNLVNPTIQQILNAGPCTAAQLPVTLKLFNSKCNDNKVTLNWITTNEYNNSHFVLQRSANGSSWTEVGVVQAAGNSGGEHKYTFTDGNPLINQFYRLAQYDIDGRVHYSSVLRSACSARDEFMMWPNPATDKLVVSMKSTNVSVAMLRIFDSKGVFLRAKHLIVLPGQNQYEVDINAMPSGVYMIQIVGEGGAVQTNRLFVKK